MLREAEKVIAQNDRIKCTADSPGSLAGIRLQDDRSEGKIGSYKQFEGTSVIILDNCPVTIDPFVIQYSQKYINTFFDHF